MGGSSNMVCGPSKAEAMGAFLNADEFFDRARNAREQANRNEDNARTAWHKAKEALAATVGYNVGDPPLSVIVGDGRVVRFTTSNIERCRRDDQQICVSIEKVV